ncbi:MAG: PKD domain-containing protein, partial [Methermicoccaceae archaeon]
AISSTGENPTAGGWTEGGNDPVDYLLTMQDSDGAFFHLPNVRSSPVMSTSYCTIALLGKRIPVVSSSTPPVAIATVKHTINNTGSPTYLNGSASHDPDGSIVSYSWSFGDGSIAAGAVVSHVYSSYRWNGSYQPFTVMLTVTDDKGATGTTTIPVVVFMAGDANGDGVANILDAALVGLHWQAQYGTPEYNDGADLNNDDVVNILDAALVGLNWNRRA